MVAEAACQPEARGFQKRPVSAVAPDAVVEDPAQVCANSRQDAHTFWFKHS